MDRNLSCVRVNFSLDQSGRMAVQIHRGAWPSELLDVAEVEHLRGWLNRNAEQSTVPNTEVKPK
jgi:hypothetical protein